MRISDIALWQGEDRDTQEDVSNALLPYKSREFTNENAHRTEESEMHLRLSSTVKR